MPKNKKHVEEPEVVTESRGRGRPKKTSTALVEDGNPKFPTRGKFEGQNELETILQEEISAFQELEHKAAWHGLRIGILIIKARAEIPHGGFMPWVKENIPFSHGHAWRFVRLAEEFLARKRIEPDAAYDSLIPLRQLTEGSKGDAKTAKALPKPVQMAFEFIGDNSFRGLCEELGIDKAPSRGSQIGGNARLIAWLQKHHPECEATKASDLPDDIREEWEQALKQSEAECNELVNTACMKTWRKKVQELFVEADKRKTHKRLPNEALETAAATLQTVREILVDEMKRRRSK